MGKWSHLKEERNADGTPKYKTYVEEDPKKRERVNAAKDVIRRTFAEANVVPTLGGLVDALEEVLAEEDVLKAKLSANDDRQQALSELIQDGFKQQKVTSVKSTSGATFYEQDDLYPKVVDKAAAIAWAEADQPEILTVNYNTLAAITKAAIEENAPLPDGVDVFIKTRVKPNKRRRGEVE